MTHSGGKPHTNVGDKGQRFEIHGVMHDGTDEVFGWTNDPCAEQVIKKVREWPRYRDAYVVDREIKKLPKKFSLMDITPICQEDMERHKNQKAICQAQINTIGK